MRIAGWVKSRTMTIPLALPLRAIPAFARTNFAHANATRGHCACERRVDLVMPVRAQCPPYSMLAEASA
jgi:hypothetical protein